MSDTSPPPSLDWERKFRDSETPWERPGLHPAVAVWQDRLVQSPGASVIIPGCGRAPELVHFAGLGLDVTGADLSETASGFQRDALARAGVTATLELGDVLAFRPDRPVDFVWEQTFLCAIHPHLRERYETALHDWLKPGGSLLALFMQKDERGGPPYGCSLDAMRTLFPEERWHWPAEADFQPHPHPSLNGTPELAGILTRR